MPTSRTATTSGFRWSRRPACARKAEGGDILVTDVVRALAGSRGGFDFVSVGELELKGLDHPVGACRVAWIPLVEVSQDFAVPLPGRIASAVSATFVGRGTEREALHAIAEGHRHRCAADGVDLG